MMKPIADFYSRQQYRFKRSYFLSKWPVIISFFIITISIFMLNSQFGTSQMRKLFNELSHLCNNKYHNCYEITSDYKFIIIMATYQRRNNKTPFYIDRAVRSIMGQTYRNWEVFVTGDKYSNEIELKHLFRNVPQDKLFMFNLEVPGERNRLSGIQLWICAGATALNNALDRAAERYKFSKMLENNKLLIAHLDDDDTWHPYHLQNFINMYKRFPDVHFVWSKGYYCASKSGGIPFPQTNLPDDINNMPPTFSRTLHSTVSWKMKTFMSFRYRRAWDFIKESPVASDADLWRRMTHFMKLHNLSYYHSAVCTVEHLEEMGKPPCNKADKMPLWY